METEKIVRRAAGDRHTFGHQDATWLDLAPLGQTIVVGQDAVEWR